MTKLDLFREGNGMLDWRALSVSARASGISYRLANGRQGEITDPRVLRIFYTRLSILKWERSVPLPS
jgi:hypothetical protein